AVGHRLGLAVRRGDRARVEVVAADHDGRGDAAGGDEPVDREPRLGARAVAEPADTRRKALKGDLLRGQLEPALQERVAREETSELVVDRGDVRRVAGEDGPAEGADAAGEE